MEKSWGCHFAAACLQRSWVMAIYFLKLSFAVGSFYCLGQIIHTSTECLWLQWPLCVSERVRTFFLQLFTWLEDKHCTKKLSDHKSKNITPSIFSYAWRNVFCLFIFLIFSITSEKKRRVVIFQNFHYNDLSQKLILNMITCYFLKNNHHMDISND